MRDLISEKAFDVAGISETWLDNNIHDSFVSIKGYQLFRCDYKSTINKHGVCLFASISLKCKTHDNICPNVVAIHLSDLNVHIMMVYRPPSNTAAQDNDLTNGILTFCNGKEIVLMGDFNRPTLKWDGDIFDFRTVLLTSK